MFRLKKKIKSLEARISSLEKRLDTSEPSCKVNEDGASYKEVIEEWLNGKKN